MTTAIPRRGFGVMSSNMGTISSHETEALTIMGRGLRDNLPGPETDVLNFRANDNTIFKIVWERLA